MDEYKEWAKQFNESRPVSFYDGAIAAWQHQQAKVEELQKKLDAIKEVMADLEQGDSMFLVYEKLEQALKGEAE